MRIRTVKPEFWTHPVMVRQSDSAKLLAIGLLNYADDDGFFYATPQMVRAALRPLDDDSTTTRRLLDELSRIGYLAVREHSTHGEIGYILSFRSHQVIDRPKSSKIKDLYESAIARRLLDDQSLRELGKGTREQGKGTREGNRGAADAAPCEVLTVTGGGLQVEPPGIAAEPSGTPPDALESPNGAVGDKSPASSPEAALDAGRGYHKDARTVLYLLNEATRKNFRETDGNLSRISARLREPGVDLEGVRKMIARQVAMWNTDAKMQEFLRPETLFGKQKFDGYYAGKDSPIPNGQSRPLGQPQSAPVLMGRTLTF